MEDLIGSKINKITITSNPVSYLYSGKIRRIIYGVCECGKLVKLIYSPKSNSYPQSCGCSKSICNDKIKLKKMRSSFEAMHRRCKDLSGSHFKYYKNKGVYVCERWATFKNFFEDMQETWMLGLQLDRFPNRNGIYEKSNCRWASPKQQQRNKDKVILNESDVAEIRKSDLLQSELSKIYKVNQCTISRIKNKKRWQ